MTDYIPFTADEYAPDAPATALHFEKVVSKLDLQLSRGHLVRLSS